VRGPTGFCRVLTVRSVEKSPLEWRSELSSQAYRKYVSGELRWELGMDRYYFEESCGWPMGKEAPLVVAG
jgi:hypothetical protein